MRDFSGRSRLVTPEGIRRSTAAQQNLDRCKKMMEKVRKRMKKSGNGSEKNKLR